jgi:tetratricopeptide (TPR) repeat protein
LQTYARELLDPDDVARLRVRHAADTARRISEMRPRLATPDEPAAVRAIAALGADLHAAWAHACANDRDLAAHLAADMFEYAYHRQRLDLLDWGRTVAEWQPERPLPPRALAAAAAACWASGELKRAHVFASRGVDVPGGDGVGHAVNQLACLAMFDGRHEDAMALFGRAARLHNAAGELVRALSCEISVRQAMTYAGRPAEAAAQLGPLRERALASENPSAIAWAHYVMGEALADSDVGAALAAYAAAIARGEKSDCRLFVMLARSSIVRLSARHADPRRAFAEFERVLEQWEDLGNQAAQWWALANLVVLLARTGRDADAALLGGAAIAARHQHFAVALDEAALQNALDQVRRRLGPAAADQALAAGEALHFAAAVEHARQVIKR